VLRAIILGAHERCSPELLLDVCDRRTLVVLVSRAGLRDGAQLRHCSASEFLDRQRFVPLHNAGVKALRELLLSQG
jgi:hypothetical protein